jgi:excisionase family DNA binding protein
MADQPLPSVTRHTAYGDLPEWLTPEEVQSYLDVSRNTVYSLLKEGAIPSQRWGRLIRVPRSALAPRV